MKIGFIGAGKNQRCKMKIGFIGAGKNGGVK
jgi:hypothetical protein